MSSFYLLPGNNWHNRGDNHTHTAGYGTLPFNVTQPYKIMHENNTHFSWVINVCINNEDPLKRFVLYTGKIDRSDFFKINRFYRKDLSRWMMELNKYYHLTFQPLGKWEGDDEIWWIEYSYQVGLLHDIEVFRRALPRSTRLLTWRMNMENFHEL
ncbi:hypothetical protein J1614_001565 [Plenodomus biglobosus]|nr:hypothetical protein J1614_001565 [Plenodomus biglobosus]